MKKALSSVCLLACVLSGGCASSGGGATNAVPVPDHWHASVSPEGGEVSAASPDAKALAQWWAQFGDPVLDALIGDALAHNLDLRTAEAQLAEARARHLASGADLGPSLDANASVQRTAASRTLGGGPSRNLYRAGLDAGWEVDLFGRLRSSHRATAADVAASVEQWRATRVSLVAEVALDYIDLRTAQRRLALAESTLSGREQSLALASWRQQAGLVSELDVAQARTERDSSRATLPVLRATVSSAQDQLAVLLGEAPGALEARLTLPVGNGDGNVPRIAHDIAVAIPADTLRQRPDVRAAEQRLAAQAARLDAARAARYPGLQLSGSIGWEALTAQGLGASGSLARSLLASLTAPIFDSGRIHAAIGIEDARLEQARLAYQAAVLVALQDVENALVSLSAARERESRLADATASAQEAYTIAQFRYQGGLVDFLAVLDSERTLISLQDQLASGRGDVATAQVRLYKALGGGWTNETVMSASATAGAKE
ncbi:MAG TPA: efflux transporter outer membrane subunit [Moraxellaceae bacterium]|nr:efflux transporter outer membrane subunit [Moraxellaceae bacterium]